ncbi:proprotein convertase subtilisin/kexin type 9-like [Glandiceps talaboti]
MKTITILVILLTVQSTCGGWSYYSGDGESYYPIPVPEENFGDYYCTTRMSSKSGPADDAEVEVGCEEWEVMTSCSSFTEPSDEASHGTRDGEEIKVIGRPKCIAYNGFGGNGVYAVAQCCFLPSNVQCYYEKSQLSGNYDDAIAKASCSRSIDSLPTIPTGCMARTFWQWLDGARPYSEENPYNIPADVQFPLDKNSCVAQNGVFGQGVYAQAACCTGLECGVVYSKLSGGDSGDMTYAKCEDGYVLTGCNVFSWWAITDGAVGLADDNQGYYFDQRWPNDNNVCVAYNGGKGTMGTNDNGVWAVATCCRSAASP